jgi:hypothetical protein
VLTVIPVIGDSRVSSPVVYEDPGFYDKKLKVFFEHCRPMCDHTSRFIEGLAIGYHAECFGFASSLPSPAFLHATGYRFEPMPWQDRQRYHRIKQLLAARLQLVCPALPVELRLMVARHLVRPCAVSTIEALWAVRQSFDCCVDTSKSVWASYVHIDGIRYVAALSNEPGLDFRRVLDADRVPRVGTVYILEDHLGIRQLVFAAFGERVELPSFGHAKQALWWRALPTYPKQLVGKSDVSHRLCMLFILIRSCTLTCGYVPAE